jgi:GTP-binding protein HflX
MLELERLVDTAGGEVVARIEQTLDMPVAATFIGKGKLEELKAIIEMENCKTVVFDDDLKPKQLYNIERALGEDIKVLDRSGLILDIFATRARTSEAKIQVELAQLEYLKPRLAGMWVHLSRQEGGSIGARGPGETQLETDRRVIDRRISKLKDKLNKVESQRQTRRKSRGKEFRVSLLGYTNAGKSTLLNKLTNSDAYAEDKLFATLDPRTRIFRDEWGRKMLFTDTVGFIRKLPHDLVESFKSTLAEAVESDMILTVAEAGHPALRDHLAVVRQEIVRLGISDKHNLLVLNKIDLIDDFHRLDLERDYPKAVLISAATGEGIDNLIQRIIDIAGDSVKGYSEEQQ